jgi:hypothetical protein
MTCDDGNANDGNANDGNANDGNANDGNANDGASFARHRGRRRKPAKVTPATNLWLASTPNSSYVYSWTVAGTFLSPPAPGFRAVPKPRSGGV